jgi:hypothetical protein
MTRAAPGAMPRDKPRPPPGLLTLRPGESEAGERGRCGWPL